MEHYPYFNPYSQFQNFNPLSPQFQNFNPLSPQSPSHHQIQSSSQFPSTQFPSSQFPYSQFPYSQFHSQLPPQTEDDEEYVSESEPEPEPQPQPTRGKAPNQKWTHKEEEELATAWCTITEDKIRGKDQARDQFWSRVTKCFHKKMKKEPYRTPDSCNTKWSNMNKIVSAFNGIYTNHYNQWPSGANEDVVYNQALATYASEKKNEFTLKHVWVIVKGSDKWKQLEAVENFKRSSKRGRPQQRVQSGVGGSSHNPGNKFGVDLNYEFDEEVEETQRPVAQGRDAAKKRAKSVSSTSSANTSNSRRSEELERIWSEFAGLRTHLDDIHRQEDMKLLFQYVSHFSGDVYEFAMAEKRRLMEKYRRD